MSMVVSHIGRKVSVAAVRAQCTLYQSPRSLENLGPATTAAVGMRNEATEMDRRWARERVLFARALRHSHNIRRLGLLKQTRLLFTQLPTAP